MDTPQDIAKFEALSTEAASVKVQPSAWVRVRRSTSVRIGGIVLLVLLAIALLAPWLGTLDPSLYLIGPAGDQIAANDDAEAGVNTNSLIANLTLPADGQYIIIATHFGAQYGGTTGTYSLTLTQLN